MKNTDGFAIFDKLLKKEDIEYIGRYHIQKLIGQGGMGKVFRAYDEKLDRLVALKVLSVKDVELAKFLTKEARAIARLRHPNIVKIFDFDSDKEYFYIAMEYISGETLEEYLKKNRPDYNWSTNIMLQLVEGVYHAHHEGVVHRDLKPANIILQDGIPKIMDFGLAKFLDSATTQDHIGWGTMQYMSPEQVSGKSSLVDQRSDIYTLGVIFYEMLSGKSAYNNISYSNLTRIVQETPKSIRKINNKIPKRLEYICAKCMEKRQRDRYTSAKILAKELRAFIDQKGVFTFSNVLSVSFCAIAVLLAICTIQLLGERDSLQRTVYELRLAEENPKTEKPLEKENNKEQIVFTSSQDFVNICGEVISIYPIIQRYPPKVVNKLRQMCKQFEVSYKEHRVYGKVLFSNAIFEKSNESMVVALDEAIKEFDKAIEMNPKDYISYFLCYLAYYIHPHKEDQQDKYLKKLQSFDNEMGFFAKGYLMYLSAYNQKNNDEMVKEFNRALDFFDAGIEYNAHFAYLYWGKAMVLKMLNSDRRSILELYEKAISCDPGNFLLIHEVASFAYKADFIDNAYEYYNWIARQEDFCFSEVWYMRARVLKRKELYNEAIKSISIALEKGYPRKHCYHERLLLYRLTKQYDRALSDCTMYIGLEPHDKSGYQKRGEIYIDMNKLEEALEDFKQALFMDKNQGFVAFGSLSEQDKKLVFQISSTYRAMGKRVSADAILRNK